MTIFEALPDTSRVWVYQSSRPFSERETAVLNSQLAAFARQWTAHNHALQAQAQVVRQQFVVLAVDESQAGASGCSIDKSVHFLESLEQQFGVSLFDRLRLAYLDASGEVVFCSKTDFLTEYTGGGVSDVTFVFDNMVSSLGELRSAWLKPLRESWHWRFLGLHKNAI
ncbi:MAG: hypothetical protein RL757_1756 [Bacteroidota bacterium]|jgi:sulfite reductase alpha subunit-like flavoprotein